MAGRLTEAFEAGMAAAGHAMDVSAYGAELAARAAFWMGDAQRAHLAVEAHLARPDRGRVIAADRLVMAAGLRAIDGDPAGALPDFRSALAVYRDLDIAVLLGLNLITVALVVGPEIAEARAAADEAREIFTRLGSPPMLARLDAGLARPPGRATGRRDTLVRSATES